MDNDDILSNFYTKKSSCKCSRYYPTYGKENVCDNCNFLVFSLQLSNPAIEKNAPRLTSITH